jgi:plastocyanin
MFDSQNNNKGGYNVGDRYNRPSGGDVRKQFQMSYFMSAENPTATEGNSYFPIEWTNQHGCGENTPSNPNKLNCEMVLQFMCQPDNGRQNDNRDNSQMRDGTSTGRNGYKASRSRRGESERDFQRRENGQNRRDKGMNEPFAWYDKCDKRRRNKGLFTADQKLKQDKSTHTRQNPNGNRNGYECPEERDYYPYWHPTDWKDIAILTEDPSLCNYYRGNSFNNNTKFECRETWKDSNKHSHLSKANTEDECEDVDGEWVEVNNFLEKLPGLNKAQCQQAEHIWGHALYGDGTEECLVALPPVDCQKAEYTRVNHLGNSENMKASKYMWKLPHFPSGTPQKCVFRLRYNISTDDYDPWTTDSKKNNDDTVIENDPKVRVDLPNDQKLQLALNTQQTGRTFQDRSHLFKIRPRTAAMGTKNIHMLSVRGKRGNIVQTYPAVEYDFVPITLEIKKDDLVHIEWTGSNTHNNGGGGDGQAGDDGEGKGGTDRSNILPMTDRGNNFFMPTEHPDSMFKNMKAVWSARGSNLNAEDIAIQLSTSGQFEDEDELRRNNRQWQNQLNNAPASFPGMVVAFDKSGTHHYGCTRNNNFSNRSQKASIVVKDK